MKLFYQLTPEEQDAAIEHCAELVATNAIENGLRIESDDEEGVDISETINSTLQELKNRTDLKTREEKIEFLMDDEKFSDVLFELSSEMAKNAFYHDQDELVIFSEVLAERAAQKDEHDEAEELPPVTTSSKKKLLN